MMKCLLFEVDRNSLLYPSSLSTFLRPTAYSFSLNSWTELFFLRIHSCHPWTVTRLSPLRPRVHSVSWIQNFRTKWHNSGLSTFFPSHLPHSSLSTQHSALSTLFHPTVHVPLFHSSLITHHSVLSFFPPTAYFPRLTFFPLSTFASHLLHSSHSSLSTQPSALSTFRPHILPTQHFPPQPTSNVAPPTFTYSVSSVNSSLFMARTLLK